MKASISSAYFTLKSGMRVELRSDHSVYIECPSGKILLSTAEAKDLFALIATILKAVEPK